MKHSELNGFQVYGFFKSGAHRLHRSRHQVDSINVYPVADRDTGSNMAYTLNGAVDLAVPVESAALTLFNLAEATLESARGNSGVILAQFFSGLSEAASSTLLRTSEFVNGVELACERACQAIANPQDGTMLSVMRDWARALRREHGAERSFDELFQAVKGDLRDSLEATRNILPEMRRAGVVDAGASGFVEFIEGGHEWLRQGGIPASGLDSATPDSEPGPESVEFHEDHGASPPVHRYCSELIIRGQALDPDIIRRSLADLGDSLIVAGGSQKVRIHLHTNRPSELMTRMQAYGSLARQKVDDMRRQFDDAGQSGTKVAIVTDSACDLPQELLDRYGIHVIPLLIRAGDTEFLDKLSLSQERFWDLAESGSSLPSTSQPAAAQFSRLYQALSRQFAGVLSIHLAGAMSGTLRAAQGEASRIPGVTALDSRHLSASLGLLVLRAAEAAAAGTGLEELARLVPLWSAKARIFVSVTSLRYMVRGGRVSPLKGLLARVLNLKPIVSVDAEGNSSLYGKSFSERANLAKLVAMTARVHRDAPIRAYAVVHARSPAKAARLAAALDRAIGFPPLYLMEISSVIALNAGPGAVSVALMSE